ncbi:MAG: CoA-transferase, partial [Hyphomicrobiales bacterium]
MSSKIVSAEDAVAAIPDGATLAVCGTGAVLEPDLLLEKIEERFVATGHPRGLTLFLPMLPGDGPGTGGLNTFAHEGMVARIYGASFSRQRHDKLLDLIRADACEGYVIGMGTMVQLLTAAGSGKPGVFTKAGLGSFMDPRVEGGCMNAVSTSPTARVETIDGEEYLYYPAPKVTAAFLRATTADENGYLSMEEEPNSLGMAEIALATFAARGEAIAQVKRVARANSLDPRLVRVPGPLVSKVVVNPFQRQLSVSMADPLHGASPFYAGALKAPTPQLERSRDLNATAVVLRRAALELRDGDVINLGAGVATQLPRIALEEDISERVVFTNEHGVFGGMMGTVYGGSFVPAVNADAVMDSAFQFGFYDGGGLDVTFLGIGEVDGTGNLNVSRFGPEINGPGGFNNIVEKTPRIVFCGTLTAGGMRAEVRDGKLVIVKEGRNRKFVKAVEQI